MSSIRRSIDYIYNPDNQSKEELIDSFVVRLKTFCRLFKDIKEAPMLSPEQPYLIEGKRGMGKTTLLLRLGYAIENDEALNSWLVPIVFNEEEYSISRLFKLWERVAVLLAEKDPQFQGLYEEMDLSYNNYSSRDDYEYAAFELLNNSLEEKGKKLILFIDNFGDIFSKFNKKEIQRLRTVLQTNTNFRIFAASSVVLEAFYDEKHPFFDFFKVTRLRGLNKEEANELLLKLGETYKQNQIKEIIENQQGRVEALRRLTGGVIRTIVLLFEIFIDQENGSAFSDLEAILDRVTPLYKHRMDDLPAQQQEIVEAIAFAWDAINVKEISQKTKIPSKSVSAQLRQMEKNEIITKKLTNTKNHFYQLSERFFNIWYLMRNGRKGDKRKVLWLVRFLEEWCDEGALVERAKQHINYLQNGDYDIKGAYYLTEALASTRDLPQENQDELLKATREFLSKNNSEYLQHLSESDVELHEKAMVVYKEKKYEHALEIFLKMRQGDSWRIGYCYKQLRKIDEAEKHFLDAVKKGNVNSMFSLGFLYKNFIKNIGKAEEYYLKAAKKEHVSAMYNLGHLYHHDFQNYSKAEKYYLKAAEKKHTNAMICLGNLYTDKIKDFNKAEEYFLKAVEAGNTSAFFNLGLLFENHFSDSQKAEKYYFEASEKGHTAAMNNLAFLYYTQLTKKTEAVNLAGKSYLADKNDASRLTFAKALLWNNKSEKSIEVAQEFLYDEKFFTDYKEFFQDYLFLLLAKNQYQFLYSYFNSPKAEELSIKDILKPIWYALMYYMQDQYPNEYLRMGEELEETVKEIIEKVEQMRIDYA